MMLDKNYSWWRLPRPKIDVFDSKSIFSYFRPLIEKFSVYGVND
jgi:hypothetical protein